MKRVVAGVLSFFVALSMSSCEAFQKKTYDMDTSSNGIYVYSDKTISSITVKDFSDDYLNLDEFKEEYLIPAIADYNKANGGEQVAYREKEDDRTQLPVSISKLELENNSISMVLDYNCAETCVDFFKEVMYTDESFLDVKELEEIEIPDNIKWVQVSDNTEVTPETAFKSKRRAFLVTTDFPGTIQVQGIIKYVSSNVTVLSDYTCSVSDDAFGYIIFKK